jgi:hypothetical protein
MRRGLFCRENTAKQGFSMKWGISRCLFTFKFHLSPVFRMGDRPVAPCFSVRASGQTCRWIRQAHHKSAEILGFLRSFALLFAHNSLLYIRLSKNFKSGEMHITSDLLFLSSKYRQFVFGLTVFFISILIL